MNLKGRRGASYCYIGTYFFVDLSTGKVSSKTLPKGIQKLFIGGNGFCAYLFYKHMNYAEPFSKDNILVFSSGPLTAAEFICTDRYCVATRSPLTNFFFDSYSGGGFGFELKKCCDALVIIGKSNKPVYLELTDNTCRIKDATHLWGLNTEETANDLSTFYGNIKPAIITIGVGGENLVRYANIMCSGRAAGRGGCGAVMGSKNLKAIVAFSDNKHLVFDDDKLKLIQRELIKKIKNHPVLQNLSKYGTPAVLDLCNKLKILGTKNWQYDYFEEGDKLTAEQFFKNYTKGFASCKRCPIHCGHLQKISGITVKVPEFETIYAFGPLLDCSDKKTISDANHLCNLYGIDTISTGGSIAFAMDCTERKIFDFKIKWNDKKGIIDMIHKIALKKDVGRYLAEGTRYVNKLLGGKCTEFCMNAKGLEFPAYSPRSLLLMQLGYATSTRGGSHHDTRPFGYKPDKVRFSNLAQCCINIENRTAYQDCLIICRFTEQVLGMELNENYASILNYATGFEYDIKSIKMVGERVYNLERLINVKLGMMRCDDTLPNRFVRWRKKFENALSSYYKLRGWSENGIPKKSKLKTLSIV